MLQIQCYSEQIFQDQTVFIVLNNSFKPGIYNIQVYYFFVIGLGLSSTELIDTSVLS